MHGLATHWFGSVTDGDQPVPSPPTKGWGMDHTSRWAGMVVMGEQSGHAAHWVGSDQVWAASLGWTPRAVCDRVFQPAALAAPLPALCPDCVAARLQATSAPRRTWRIPRALRRRRNP